MLNQYMNEKPHLPGGSEFLDSFVTAADISVTNTTQVSSLFDAVPVTATGKIVGKNTNSVLIDHMYACLAKELKTMS